MKNKLLTISIALMSFTFIVACPSKSDNQGSADGDLNEPKASISAPASEITTDNAEAEADALLKDIDNL